MDEIKDGRFQTLETADDWEIRHRDRRNHLVVQRTVSEASTVASAPWLRRPPSLKVIQGGRDGASKQEPTGRLGQTRLFVVR